MSQPTPYTVVVATMLTVFWHNTPFCVVVCCASSVYKQLHETVYVYVDAYIGVYVHVFVWTSGCVWAFVYMRVLVHVDVCVSACV